MLAQSGVADEDTLYILARLMGGAKKRKKKTYTKPKKQKHKHKKIKLRVLKFFKVGRVLHTFLQGSPGVHAWNCDCDAYAAVCLCCAMTLLPFVRSAAWLLSSLAMAALMLTVS